MTKTQEQVRDTMQIEVIAKPSKKSKKEYSLRKFGGLGKWILHYEVEPNGRVIRVALHKNDETLPRPFYLQFFCPSELEKITGVGFSECKKGIEQYRLKGPCGGCFSLHDDIPVEGAQSVLVENWGHQRNDKKCYHFGLWLGDDTVHSDEFDPQIYNDGVFHEPPPPPRKRKAAG